MFSPTPQTSLAFVGLASHAASQAPRPERNYLSDCSYLATRWTRSASYESRMLTSNTPHGINSGQPWRSQQKSETVSQGVLDSSGGRKLCPHHALWFVADAEI